jgi:hypothetical protein
MAHRAAIGLLRVEGWKIMMMTNASRVRRVGVRRAAGWAGIACAAVLVTACSPGSATAARTSSQASVVLAAKTAPRVYLAEGQDIRGTLLYRPACRTGCPLSGDSTAILATMTWRTWSRGQAVGTGTYELDGCDPDCAAGPLYRVPAVVTLSHPVRACTPHGTRWLWTRASFRFPHGLPTALRGSNAPLNPWVFSSVISAARHGCAR